MLGNESATQLDFDNTDAGVCAVRFRRMPEVRLLSFFLDLSFEQRVHRFGIPSTDRAIRSWRSTIDKDHYLPISLEHGRRLVGLVELFGSCREGWRRPELAVTVRLDSDRPAVRWRFLDIGLAAARDLGAVDVFTALNTRQFSTAELSLQYAATVDQESDIAVIPCHSMRCARKGAGATGSSWALQLASRSSVA